MPNIDKVVIDGVRYNLVGSTPPKINKIRANNVDYDIGSSNSLYIDTIRIDRIDYNIQESPYIVLNYIESNGNQIINTNIGFSTDLVIDMYAEYTQTTSSYQFMGYTSVRGAHFGIDSTGKFTLEGGITSSLSPLQKRHLIHTIFQGGNSLNIDGTIITRNDQNTPSSESRYRLFSSENKTCYCKIYECKIYKSNELIRHFIPVKRKSDNKICMYDLVNEQFYTNAGSGDFIAGPEA